MVNHFDMIVADSDLSVEVTPRHHLVGSTQPPSSGTESVPSDPEDFERPRGQGVPAQVGSPHNPAEVFPPSDVSEQSEWESDDAAPVPVEENSDNEEGDRRRFTAAIREALQSLDLVDLKSVFRNRACLMRSPPAFLKGMHKSASVSH